MHDRNEWRGFVREKGLEFSLGDEPDNCTNYSKKNQQDQINSQISQGNGPGKEHNHKIKSLKMATTPKGRCGGLVGVVKHATTRSV